MLTPRGRDLFPVVVALRQWGERHFFEPGKPRSELLDRRDGKPLAPLEIRAADGRRVEARETEVRKAREAGVRKTPE